MEYNTMPKLGRPYKRNLGCLPDGRWIYGFRIENNKNEAAEILDYGATINSLCVLDRHGKLGDVVIGIDEASDIQERTMLGSMIGRCANRIANGHMVLKGQEIQLETDRRGHTLHSGSSNYATKSFKVLEYKKDSISLCYNDIGGAGFDAAVDVQVRYSLSDNSELQIEYKLTAHKATVLCPTNHSYFNLSNYCDIREDSLTIYSEELAVKAANGVPDGQTMLVAETPYDFRKAVKIETALSKIDPPKLDDTFLVPGKGLHPIAVLYSERTGRKMSVYSDMPALVVFTPANCDRQKPRYQQQYPAYGAVCLETQFVPNAVNIPSFDSPVFNAGQTLVSRTVYAFSCDCDE